MKASPDLPFKTQYSATNSTRPPGDTLKFKESFVLKQSQTPLLWAWPVSGRFKFGGPCWVRYFVKRYGSFRECLWKIYNTQRRFLNLSVPKKEVQEVSETTVASTEDSVTAKCESEIRLPSVIGLYCFVPQTADTVNPLLRPPLK